MEIFVNKKDCSWVLCWLSDIVASDNLSQRVGDVAGSSLSPSDIHQRVPAGIRHAKTAARATPHRVGVYGDTCRTHPSISYLTSGLEHFKLASTLMFYPIAIETAGTWDDMAIELVLVQEIGRRTAVITQDTRETVFLFQRLSIALQRGNAVSFLNTMNTE